jgi:hypothetical protein
MIQRLLQGEIMKYILLLAIAFAGLTARADQVNPNSLVHERACSSYLSASEDEHQSSAYRNFINKGYRDCLDKGYTQWQLLEYKTSGLFRVPVYCYSGTFLCQ